MSELWLWQLLPLPCAVAGGGRPPVYPRGQKYSLSVLPSKSIRNLVSKENTLEKSESTDSTRLLG